MEDYHNGITLLKDLGQITLNYKDQHYPYESYINLQHILYNVAQGALENADCYKQLQIMLRQ